MAGIKGRDYCKGLCVIIRLYSFCCPLLWTSMLNIALLLFVKQSSKIYQNFLEGIISDETLSWHSISTL